MNVVKHDASGKKSLMRITLVRESSFNMTRWGGGGDEDIEGGH